MWVLWWSDREKRLVQVGHWNGLIPVCEWTWRDSSSDRMYDLSQASQVHWYSFSPVWRRRWSFRCELFEYESSQPGQWHLCASAVVSRLLLFSFVGLAGAAAAMPTFWTEPEALVPLILPALPLAVDARAEAIGATLRPRMGKGHT